jgi:hypothetical protein
VQQFTVPQFIDVEDKIIGPITARQFIIMLTGGIIMVIFYRLFDFTLFLLASVLTLGICVVFSFVKVNGRPFHLFILNIIQTLKRSKLRIWNQEAFKLQEIPETADDIVKKTIVAPHKEFTRSRLNELSLIVDTSGFYRGEESGAEANIEKIT